MKNLFKKILAIGLAATMTLGMAVTSFADEQTPAAPKSTENVEVWVNGKDVKAKGNVQAAFNKTASVKLADLVVTKAPAIIVDGELPKNVTVSEGATKPGTLTYTATATHSTKAEGTGITKVTVTDASKLTAGEIAYTDKWSGSVDGLKIEGTPAKGDTITIAGEWVQAGTDAEADGAADFGTVITLVKDVQVGLTKSLPAKHKYLISVIAPAEDGENTYEAAFPGNKAKKSNVVKVKFNNKTKDFTVTAGKEAGVVEVWIAELDSKAKKITAYKMFTVEAKMAPAKFDILVPAKKNGEGIETEAAITKKTTLSVGDDITLSAIASKPTTVDEDTTYTWSVKLPKGFTENDVKVEPATDTKSAKFTFTKLADESKAANFTITCTNNQSQKKASFKVTVVNNIKTVTLGSVAMDCAYTDKVVQEIKLGSDVFSMTSNASGETALKELKSTDKVKAFITSNAKLSQKATESAEAVYEGYIYTKGEKKDTFKLTEKSKAVSAKLAKDGTLTLTAKKGTEPGTKAKLLLVITHKDKTIDVKEAIITVGEAATAITDTTTAYTLKVGKTQTLKPTITEKNADVVWTTDNKGVATVDEKGVVTAKKAGTAKITVKSGEVKLEYTITVEEEAAATDSNTQA